MPRSIPAPFAESGAALRLRVVMLDDAVEFGSDFPLMAGPIAWPQCAQPRRPEAPYCTGAATAHPKKRKKSFPTFQFYLSILCTVFDCCGVRPNPRFGRQAIGVVAQKPWTMFVRKLAGAGRMKQRVDAVAARPVLRHARTSSGGRQRRVVVSAHLALQPAGDGCTLHLPTDDSRLAHLTSSFELCGPGVFAVGRAASCAVCIPLPTVSLRHALLKVGCQIIFIVFLSS